MFDLTRFMQTMINYLRDDPIIASGITTKEVRELSYQSPDFAYPNIRLHIDEVTPRGEPPCHQWRIKFRTLVFSLEKSSYECLYYSSVIASRLDNKIVHATGTYDGMSIHLMSVKPHDFFAIDKSNYWGGEIEWYQDVTEKA